MAGLYALVHKKDSANYERGKWVLEKFEQYSKKQKKIVRVLDIACGDGTFAAMFVGVNKSVDVTAVDRSLKYDERTRLSGISFHKWDIFEWDAVMDNRYKYDMIFCGEFCEHLPDGKPEELLAMIYRWLKKNGVLILTVPNFLIKSGGHLRTYNEESMLKLVKDFKVIETAALPAERALFHCCVCRKI